MFDIDEIKSRLTIFDAARALGITLKGRGSAYHSPFREDGNPSFSIFDDGKRWKDHATGDSGDVIDFLAQYTRAGKGEAIKIAANITGMSLKPIVVRSAENATLDSEKLFVGANKKVLCIPELYWSSRLAHKLQASRGYTVLSLKIAFERGVFGFCEYKGKSAWLVTDGKKRVAQTRRVDGAYWRSFANRHKAETLRGSDCSVPIGLEAIGTRNIIALCEGSTDFLAAFHFAYMNNCDSEIAPLAMLGASQRISSGILQVFQGKRVIIFPDMDEAGKRGLENWGRQIAPYAAKLLYFDFSQFSRSNGIPVKDLSDFILLDPDEWEQARPYTNPFYKILTEI